MRSAPILLFLVSVASTTHAAQLNPGQQPGQKAVLAKAPQALSWNAQPIEPRDLVLLGRVRNPDASIAALQGFVPLPNVRGMILGSLGPVGAALAPGAPMDLLMALNPDGGNQPLPPMFAFGVGIGNLEGAKNVIREQLQGELSELARGVFAVRLFGGQRKETHCLLGPSPGAAPYRLACGEKIRDVNALGPYLIRLMPERNLGPADLHAELRIAPAYGRYGEALRGGLRLLAVTAPMKLQLGQPAFDRALTDILQGLTGEIQSTIAEIDRATIDLTLSQSGVEVRAAYRLRGQSSWLSQVLKEEAGRTAAPSQLFFRLPRDSRTAYYSAPGITADRAAKVTTLLASLLEGFLEHEGLSPADRKALADLLRAPWPEQATVWSSGPMDAPAPPAAAKAPAGLLGSDYSLGGYVGSPEPLRRWLKDGAAAYNRPAVQALLKKKMKALDLTVPPPVMKALAAPKGLPARTSGVQIVLQLPEDKLAGVAAGSSTLAAGKPKVQKLVQTTIYFLVVQDGERSWMGGGAHLPTIVRRLKEQLSLPEEKTLARREGLEALREGRRVSGGYWTVGGLAESIWRVVSRTSKRPADAMARLLVTAPHHGDTPMLFFTSTRESGPERELQLLVPKPSIEDVIAIVLGLSSEAKH